MRRVEVIAYQDEWPLQFEEEANRLKEIFTGELIDVHHIGSTSIQGLSAKPVIDIMPVAASIDRVDGLNDQMKKIGYEVMGEFGIPGRRFFRKGGDNRTHHIHVFEDGSEHIIRHLAFRDYLRTHPEEARQYGSLKEKLAREHPTDMEAYIDGKAHFVIETEKKALVWYKQIGKR